MDTTAFISLFEGLAISYPGMTLPTILFAT